jgi:hypothetical protein
MNVCFAHRDALQSTTALLERVLQHNARRHTAGVRQQGEMWAKAGLAFGRHCLQRCESAVRTRSGCRNHHGYLRLTRLRCCLPSHTWRPLYRADGCGERSASRPLIPPVGCVRGSCHQPPLAAESRAATGVGAHGVWSHPAAHHENWQPGADQCRRRQCNGPGALLSGPRVYLG